MMSGHSVLIKIELRNMNEMVMSAIIQSQHLRDLAIYVRLNRVLWDIPLV